MMSGSNLELVNIVASGSIQRELDLDVLFETLEHANVVKSVSKSPTGLVIAFNKTHGKAMVYRTGSFMLMGSPSEEEIWKFKDTLISFFSNCNVINKKTQVKFELSNYVFTADLGQDIDLNILDVILNTEAEYEPEQCSLLIYHPSEIPSIATVSSSGKCVINTSCGKDSANEVICELKTILNTAVP